MEKRKRTIWMVNPWIHDFTAYDLWSKPLGLLYMAALVREAGHKPVLIDLLDRHHPLLIENNRVGKSRKYGVGNFYKKEIEKPPVLRHIPRKYSQYGFPDELLPQLFAQQPKPDLIFITSLMTYWYTATYKISTLLRNLFPDIPQVLGGVYPTLIPQHAQKILNVEAIVGSNNLHDLDKVLSRLCHEEDLGISVPKNFSEYPWPAFDLYPNPQYLVVMTSKGCPYRCTFCASHLVAPTFEQRPVPDVVDEIMEQSKKLNVRDIAFYDDALLVNKEKHIKPILRELLKRRHTLRFHTPNGIHGKMLDEELAELMVKNNFKTIRISYEFFSNKKKKDISFKISNEEFVQAVHLLENAGFKKSNIESYVIMGLPGQSILEVLESMLFVHAQGVKIRLASFSPIPGTMDFIRSVESGMISADIDPLLCNKSIFPLNQEYITYNAYQKLRQLNIILNDAADRSVNLVKDDLWRSDFLQAMRNVNRYLEDAE